MRREEEAFQAFRSFVPVVPEEWDGAHLFSWSPTRLALCPSTEGWSFLSPFSSSFFSSFVSFGSVVVVGLSRSSMVVLGPEMRARLFHDPWEKGPRVMLDGEDVDMRGRGGRNGANDAEDAEVEEVLSSSSPSTTTTVAPASCVVVVVVGFFGGWVASFHTVVAMSSRFPWCESPS